MNRDLQQMKFYVCDFERGCVAVTKHPEEAAMLVSCLGESASVNDENGWLLWSQMIDGDASDSFDAAAEKMLERMKNPPTLKVSRT